MTDTPTIAERACNCARRHDPDQFDHQPSCTALTPESRAEGLEREKAETWPDGAPKRHNAAGDVLHGCEMCDGEDECTCPGNVGGRRYSLSPQPQADEPASREALARAKARQRERDASGAVHIDGSIYEGMEASLQRNGRTIAHVVMYADAVEIAAALRTNPKEAQAAPSSEDDAGPWTYDPHALAAELRRVANTFGSGFRITQLLRDAADQIDTTAMLAAAPRAQNSGSE